MADVSEYELADGVNALINSDLRIRGDETIEIEDRVADRYADRLVLVEQPEEENQES